MTDLASSNASEMTSSTDENSVLRRYNQGLTPLHPSQKSLIRVNTTIRSLVLLIAAVGIGFILNDQLGISIYSLVAPALLIGALMIFVLPHRIYRRWGYDMGTEQLRVLRGFLWRTDTIVPFNRIQHIDVAQGPLQRFFGLSTLIVHTAGTHNSIVTLPGLATSDAEEMREVIKGHIRQDMI